MRRGSNLPALAGFNETVVFDYIRRSMQGISRVEIAQHTGLSAQTVSNVCRRLVDRNMVVETRGEPQGKGKPRVMLTVNPSHGYAVGLHLDPLRTAWALYDMAGEPVRSGRAPTAFTERPDHFMDWVCGEIEGMIRDARVAREQILGLGVAAPGPLDREHGIMLTPPLFYNWRNVRLAAGLESRLGLPTQLDRDGPASAVGTLWWGGRDGAAEGAERSSGTLSGAFIYVGAGIGAGIVLNGEVYRGRASTAGEIGHLTLVTPRSRAEDLPPQSMDSGLGPPELVHCAMERGLVSADTDLGDPHAVDSGVREVLLRAEQGDVAAVALRDAYVETLARLGLGLVNLLELQQVTYGGPRISWVAEAVKRRLEQMLAVHHEARASHRVAVLVSQDSKFDAVRGAAALVFSEQYAPQSHHLLVTMEGA
ncbi:ROK family transcriptional regulator [Micrococcales bacterium 31B]|nr:ROK family transcriptional regulator [Micrococcales bacterium 31B]